MGKQEDDLFISWGEYEYSRIVLSSIIATVYEGAKKNAWGSLLGVLGFSLMPLTQDQA